MRRSGNPRAIAARSCSTASAVSVSTVPAPPPAGVCDALAAAIRQHEDPALQRRAAAALGELLFYADSQVGPYSFYACPCHGCLQCVGPLSKLNPAPSSSTAGSFTSCSTARRPRLRGILRPMGCSGWRRCCRRGRTKFRRWAVAGATLCCCCRHAYRTEVLPSATSPLDTTNTHPLTQLNSALRPQHYAAKALENVFGLGGPWAHQLATSETMVNLLHVSGGLGEAHFLLAAAAVQTFQQAPCSMCCKAACIPGTLPPGSSPLIRSAFLLPAYPQMVDSELPDVVRGTAASALCRLLRCQPSCLPALLEMGGVELLAAGERAVRQHGNAGRGPGCVHACMLQATFSCLQEGVVAFVRPSTCLALLCPHYATTC